MTDLRYHIAVARPARRTLAAWLLRKQKPLRMCYASCPECRDPVESVKPNVVQGNEYYDSRTRTHTKDMDTVRDISLLPCGHKVDHFVYVLQGYEDRLVDAVLEYERAG